MKYIDADKLKELINEKWQELADKNVKVGGGKWDTEISTYLSVLRLIDSLQQEQVVNKELGTLIACDIIEMTVKKAIDKPQDKEKEEKLMTRKINYLRSLEENYIQQEQPEVDLDFKVFAKEMDAVFNLPKEVAENTEEDPLNWEYAIARHFYELGLKARKED